MTNLMRDEQFDRELRNFLAWQADDVADAPGASDVAGRISSRITTRTSGLRLTPQLVWIILVAVTLIALIGSLVVGGILRDRRVPAVLPPTVLMPPSATAEPPPTPSPNRPVFTSGTAATSIGQLSWTRADGDATNIPAGDIFETPNGYAAIEPDPDRRRSRFWMSSDGLEWAFGPMPVPATGAVGHAVAGGEHWIWSTRELRLWRSSDFAAWTEVDLEALQPPPVDGVDWEFRPRGPTTVGSTTIFPWDLAGVVALDKLLGIPLEAGQWLSLERSGEEPALGDVRGVFRGPLIAFDQGDEPPVRVGSIRVESDGSIVTITDAEREIVVAEIDADVVGIPAATLADDINRDGSINVLRGGAVISSGIARALSYPLPLTPPPFDRAPRDRFFDLVSIEERFVGLTQDPQGPDASRLVWTSTNGLDWESLGPPDLPSAATATAHFGQILRRPAGDPGSPLVAAVVIDEAAEQRLELWSSVDGLSWVQLGLVYTYPEGSLDPFHAPSGGYLATGDDLRVHVSPTGAEWTVVDGLIGVGGSLENGGALARALTQDAAFIVELPFNGDRVMWVIRVGTDAQL